MLRSRSTRFDAISSEIHDGQRARGAPEALYGRHMRVIDLLTSRRIFLLAAASSGPPCLRHNQSWRRAVRRSSTQSFTRALLRLPPSPPVAAAPPPPPRPLDEPLAAALLERAAAAVAESLGVEIDAVTQRAAALRPSLAVDYERTLSGGAFGGASGYEASSTTTRATRIRDQFDFDLALLAIFSQLSSARPTAERAAAARAALGDRLLAQLAPRCVPPLPAACRAGAPLSELCGGLRRLLAALQSAGYLASYKLDDTDVDDAAPRRRPEPDAIGRDARRARLARRRPAAQRRPRGARPRGAGARRLPALVRRAPQDAEEYFIDDTYRPNPLEYRPNAVVLELTVARSPRFGLSILSSNQTSPKTCRRPTCRGGRTG